MSKTKNKSYTRSREHMSERADEILRLINNFGPRSRRQLAQKIGCESNSVTSAVRYLLAEGLLVELTETVFDEETQREQSLLALPSEAPPEKIKIKNTPLERIKRLTDENEKLQSQLETAVAFLRFAADRDESIQLLAAQFKKAGQK